jgi:ABC-type transport system involved in cytochrome c biogenesis permease component
MKVLWIALLFAAVLTLSEAKRKRKFEGDFEFAEEVRVPSPMFIY